MPIATSNDLHYYMKRVEREAGLTVSDTFPASPNDDQQHVIDSINATLRELNTHYYLTFKQTEYTLTTTAGTASYDLSAAPYSQTYWRVNRMAKSGVVRDADDYPLMYLDYEDRDFLQPTRTGNTLPTHWSQFGENLLFYPSPDGSLVRVRYYSLHIGTDSAGTTQKIRLSATGDVTMLDDSYEDALAYGAACKVVRKLGNRAKYKDLQGEWETWRRALNDMMQAGESAGPSVVIPDHTESYLDRKVGPFFEPHIGGS